MKRFIPDYTVHLNRANGNRHVVVGKDVVYMYAVTDGGKRKFIATIKQVASLHFIQRYATALITLYTESRMPFHLKFAIFSVVFNALVLVIQLYLIFGL